MSLTSILLVTSIVVAIVTYHLRRLKFYRAAAQFPGPIALPLIGNVYIILTARFEDYFNKFLDLMDEFPSSFRFWIGNRLVFFVYDAEHVKEVLASKLEKDQMYKLGESVFGTGLTTAPVSKWKNHRKIIQPTFNKRILDSFIPIFEKQSKVLIDRLKVQVGAKEFEVQRYLSLCVLDMICETTMGVPIDAQMTENSRYVKSLNTILDTFIMRASCFWLYPDFIFNRTKCGIIQKENAEYLHGFTNEIIQKRKLQFYKSDEKSDEEQSISPARRKAFLDLLISLSHEGEKLTDKDIQDEVMSMISAGYDTTSTTCTLVLLMLATHPEIQDKAYKEIKSIYAEKISEGEGLSNEDFSKLNYLERIIKETLRIFSMAPGVVRHLTEDFKLDGKVMPKGTSVVVLLAKTHRSKKYWPNPLTFDPDRFLPEEVAKRHPFSFVPFNAGPRNCIGQVYAMMALKMIVASVLKKYVLKKDKPVKIEDIKLLMNVTMKPVEPIKIRIEKRSRM